ncbi:MAG: HD domain-containing protein [Verrucomicrobiota bacterium]|nr:HD domain-containing protein [Verrucomicrobiota bacterium]
MKILENIRKDQKEAINALAKGVKKAKGRVLIVGGSVRDGLLGICPKDIDIEVYGVSINDLERILVGKFRIDLVGKSFGVFILKDLQIDISIPRRESKIGLKHTDFKIVGDPSLSPLYAAARRDFTINSISLDPLNGEIIDPYNGCSDLSNKLLRHVSSAFIDDPLRVLRGMQLIARYGLSVDSTTIELCRTLKPSHLPKERLWEEWKKLILLGNDISLGLEYIRACGWLKHFPELEALVGCEQDPEWHPEGDVWKHTGHCMDAFAKQRIEDPWEDLIVGLAVLCHDFGKPKTTYVDKEHRIRSPQHEIEGVPIARNFLNRLTNQKLVAAEVLPLVELHMRPLALYKGKAGDAAIRRLAASVQRVDRLVRVSCADQLGRPPINKKQFPEGEWLLKRTEALNIQSNAPKPLLMGRHLISLGMKPGLNFNTYLKIAYEAQLDGAFSDTTEAIEFIKSKL